MSDRSTPSGTRGSKQRKSHKAKTSAGAVAVDLSGAPRNVVVYTTVTPCANIKSRKNPWEQCANPAIVGEYCGIHSKKPFPYVAGVTTLRKVRKLNRLSQKKVELDALARIGRWVALCRKHRDLKRGGPAFYVRDQMVNDTDFFSTESLQETPPYYFVSYAESKQLYGFDLRSLYTILHRARTSGDPALNPYTRSPIPTPFARHVTALAADLKKKDIAVSWAPLDPPTPEQHSRMRIVDLFGVLNELQYYSSPDWYFAMEPADHRRFYAELHAIWSIRAGLTAAQKALIVPSYITRLFRIPPHATGDLTIEGLHKLTAATIRTFIMSATDKQDRVLGAMYVVSALTLVNAEARTAYPWLYDSVYEAPPARPPPAVLFGWWTRLLGGRGPIPLLEL